VLLKAAIEGEIDRIAIPKNCLDVLAQHIFGIAINQRIHVDELLKIIKRAYPYETLTREDFIAVVKYLAGAYTSLETRSVYGKITYYEDTGMIGRRGKMARVIYMTNIGTIPDQRGMVVKVGELPIGKIDENFLEKLRRGDIFVLGGSTYRFMFARGQVAQVEAAYDSLPTVPSWISEMLPLSFDLAKRVTHFRHLMQEMLASGFQKQHVLEFINSHLYVDDNSAEAIYQYFLEQHLFAKVPKETELLIEQVTSEDERYTIVHSLYGRRVNDALSRALGFVVSKLQGLDVEVSISDNGFMLKAKKHLDVKKAIGVLKADKMELVLKSALENSEILKRRFRHVAARGFMILTRYMGHKKNVGRQQVSSMILLNAVRRISNDFPMLKEARREVLEDAMDISNAIAILKAIEDEKIKPKLIQTEIPSPFAQNLATQGYSDIMRIEDKIEFLRRMHRLVLAKIGQKSKRVEELSP